MLHDLIVTITGHYSFETYARRLGLPYNEFCKSCQDEEKVKFCLYLCPVLDGEPLRAFLVINSTPFWEIAVSFITNFHLAQHGQLIDCTLILVRRIRQFPLLSSVHPLLYILEFFTESTLSFSSLFFPATTGNILDPSELVLHSCLFLILVTADLNLHTICTF